MAICAILQDFLENQQIPHRGLMHPAAFTGHQLARALKLSATEVVKSVLLRAAGGRFVVALLPAALRIDLERLREAVGVRTLRLAGEDEMQTLFPKCEVGAMCPFGVLCSMPLPMYADRSMTANAQVVLTAGVHTAAVRMGYADLERLLKPTVATFGVAGADQAPGGAGVREHDAEAGEHAG